MNLPIFELLNKLLVQDMKKVLEGFKEFENYKPTIDKIKEATPIQENFESVVTFYKGLFDKQNLTEEQKMKGNNMLMVVSGYIYINNIFAENVTEKGFILNDVIIKLYKTNYEEMRAVISKAEYLKITQPIIDKVDEMLLQKDAKKIGSLEYEFARLFYPAVNKLVAEKILDQKDDIKLAEFSTKISIIQRYLNELLAKVQGNSINQGKNKSTVIQQKEITKSPEEFYKQKN